MSHVESIKVDVNELLEAAPISKDKGLSFVMKVFVMIGLVTLIYGICCAPQPEIFWGGYYVSLLVFMGLSVGGVMLTAIFQIVRAKWSPPIRRIAEANAAFLPWAYLGFLTSYLGKDYLFPWGTKPMPGREWWMQPEFVYGRFAVLLAFLFFMLCRYVRMSLRSDIGLIREKSSRKESWSGSLYDFIACGWKGSHVEIKALQRKMSWNAPLLVALYAVIYSLFAFEMLMSMDTIWYSNMFGGFIFVGNVYLGWAITAFIAITLAKNHEGYGRLVSAQQLWDLGRLTFGFGILWVYTFFSQFLPQWYGNLPEETQWMILRTREYPWKGLGWFTFAACWVFPFLLLLSRDVKRSPLAFRVVSIIILIGMFAEKYLIVMPQLSPEVIPFSWTFIGIALGFLGLYVLSIQSFLSKYPYVPLSHPLTYGSQEW